MTGIRHRNAWIWVAVAAMSIAFVARAQSGMHNARAYTNPVLEFLAAHQSERPDAAIGFQRFQQSRSTRPAQAALLHGSGSSTWTAMQQILFVGLVSPLNVLSPKAVLCIDRAPASPALPVSFQRPPPVSLL